MQEGSVQQSCSCCIILPGHSLTWIPVIGYRAYCGQIPEDCSALDQYESILLREKQQEIDYRYSGLTCVQFLIALTS